MSKWRDIIDIHPAANLIPPMSAEERKGTGEDIKAKGGQPDIPVVLYIDPEGPWVLLDGRSRLDAMEEQGLRIFKQDNPTRDDWDLFVNFELKENIDPWAFVLSANLHRRHLNNEKKRETIAAIIKARPELTDRQIGKLVKADHKTVGDERKKSKKSNGEIPHKERREASGRKARGRKPGAKESKKLRESPEAGLAGRTLHPPAAPQHVAAAPTVASEAASESPRPPSPYEEREAERARFRAACDRVVSIIPKELANEFREAMWDATYPADTFDDAFFERYPERRPPEDDATEGVADSEEESGDSEKVCDHCGKPGGNEVAAGDGRQARLHRECEAAWRKKAAA
jgi:hypothetical protein